MSPGDPVRHAPARGPIAPGVTEISDDEFALFQTLICREAGIHLAANKKPMLVSRLMRRVNALRLGSFGEYFRFVMQDQEGELIRLLDAVSTNETWFFRNPKHFSFVEETLCPIWRADAESGRRHRRLEAWSAAASSGEEPYSLAMVLLDALPGWDINILASDLSSRVLERATAATWPIEKSTDIPPEHLKRYMLRGMGAQGGKMKAGPEIRNVIRFQRLNLNDEVWPMDPHTQFDLVFCRNVLMYFEPARRERVLRRLMSRLTPKGCLFMGDAEGLSGFPGLRMVAPSVYALREEPDTARAVGDQAAAGRGAR